MTEGALERRRGRGNDGGGAGTTDRGRNDGESAGLTEERRRTDDFAVGKMSGTGLVPARRWGRRSLGRVRIFSRTTSLTQMRMLT